MTKISKVRGMQDVLPEDQKYWKFILGNFEKKAISQGYEKIDTPLVENIEVFRRPVGAQSDIVEKQMFRVARRAETETDDRLSDAEWVLRPENTASIIRAYLESKLGNLPQPIKLYYSGPMFRYDRPQKGRLRQFTQIGCEVIGDGSPASDALVIFLSYELFKSLKLAKFITLEINSIGCKTCKKEIAEKIKDYLLDFRSSLCPDCQRRLNANPWRVLDCKEKKCRQIAEVCPAIIDLICETCGKHFRDTLEYLDDLKVPYELNSNLVRGLDYYTRTTFEIKPVATGEIKEEPEGRQSALGGGGRYDGLAEMLGGAATPAIGMSLGVERIVDELKERGIDVPELEKPQICLIQLGPKAHQRLLQILPDLLKKGLRIFSAPGKESLKAQLRLADKKNIRLAVIIGEKEVFENSAIIKDLVNNSQETVRLSRLVGRLKTKLKSSKKN